MYKQDFVLDIPQGLIYRKTHQTYQPTNQKDRWMTTIVHSSILYLLVSMIMVLFQKNIEKKVTFFFKVCQERMSNWKDTEYN